MPTAPGITFASDDVGKAFLEGADATWRGVSPTVADGEFVTVVGPSIVGNPTLSRLDWVNAKVDVPFAYPRPAERRCDAAGDIARIVSAARQEPCT